MEPRAKKVNNTGSGFKMLRCSQVDIRVGVCTHTKPFIFQKFRSNEIERTVMFCVFVCWGTVGLLHINSIQFNSIYSIRFSSRTMEFSAAPI